MRIARILATLIACLAALLPAPSRAEPLRIAAAADLRFALDEILRDFRARHPGAEVEAIYGSSGKFHAQIRQGAPFDLFLSADVELPRQLAAEGLSAGPARTYAFGRLAIWSPGPLRPTDLRDLADPAFRRIVIANPRHAPYGRRAEEALRAAGIWDKVEPRLVLGENIAQATQFVQSGNADAGILALSLVLAPGMAGTGNHALVPETLHRPLEQGFVILRRAAGNALAHRFAGDFLYAASRRVLQRHGFTAPD